MGICCSLVNDATDLEANVFHNPPNTQSSKETIETIIENTYTRTENRMLFIGRNNNNEMPQEFMYGDMEYFPDITHIYSGYRYCIYCNYITQRFYVAGDNSYGQLATQQITKNNNTDNNKFHKSMKFSLFNYFNANNIKIKKVCTNVTSSSTFWITRENTVYCNGRNNQYQLGINNNNNQFKPYLMGFAQIQNVIDIKSCDDHSMLLCGIESDILINGYLRCYDIPYDLIHLIHILFYGEYITNCRIFVTGKYTATPYRKWTEISFFKNKDVIKIDCTRHRFFCLESNGTLWDCAPFMPPKQIEHFMINNIKLIDIACADDHIETIDDSRNVYSWRASQMLQCGELHLNKDILSPQINISLIDEKIIKIKCGCNYSYAMSIDGKHFLADRRGKENGSFFRIDTMNNILIYISLGDANMKFTFAKSEDLDDIFFKLCDCL